MMRKRTLTYPTPVQQKYSSLTEQLILLWESIQSSKISYTCQVACEIDSHRSRSTNIWQLAVVKFTLDVWCA